MSRYTGTLTQSLTNLTVTLTAGGVAEVLLTQPATAMQTTIAAASNGAALPQATITVASTTGAASAGTFTVFVSRPNGTVPVVITYTGKTGSTFTGCTGGDATSTLTTGDTVSTSGYVNWLGVDGWLTETGSAPTLATSVSAIDHVLFREAGGKVYGLHLNAPGLTGATGAAGTTGLQFRSTWAITTAYVLNDVVTYNGSTWIAKDSSIGQTPAIGSTHWDQMASATAIAPPTPPPTPPPPPPVNAGTPTTSLESPAGGRAWRNVVWVGAYQVPALTTSQLQSFNTNGVNGWWLGFPASVGMWQVGNNTSEAWTADTSNPLTTANHQLQKTLRDSTIASRAHSVGSNVYLGAAPFGTTFIGNPLGVDIFNNSLWGTWPSPAPGTVLYQLNQFAQVVKQYGFDGFVWDFEYGDWNLNYSARPAGHTDGAVQAQMKLRGAQMMQAIEAGYPGSVHILYHAEYDGGYDTVLYGVSATHFQDTGLWVQWIDGMTSVGGWSRMCFRNAHMYHGSIGNLESALFFETAGSCAAMSKALSNWAYANQRIGFGGAYWPAPSYGAAGYDNQNMEYDPTITQTRFQLNNKWSMQGLYWTFEGTGWWVSNDLGTTVLNSMSDFTATTGAVSATNPYGTNPSAVSHANYVAAWQAGALQGVVDTVDPTLSGIVVTRDNATTCHASGTANDNFGVRAVRWQCGTASGAAQHTLVIDSGTIFTSPQSSITWHVTWSATGISATAGQSIVFVVEDIHGRAVSYTVQAP